MFENDSDSMWFLVYMISSDSFTDSYSDSINDSHNNSDNGNEKNNSIDGVNSNGSCSLLLQMQGMNAGT